MPTMGAASRRDLSDVQWAVLEPLLPLAARRGSPRRWPLRGLVKGAQHRTRAGCLWRDVPTRYGPWWRVYALFACWQALGVWARAEAALRAQADAKGKLSWQVSADSTTARAHIRRWRAPGQRGSFCRGTGSPLPGKIARRLGHQGPRRGRSASRGPGVHPHSRPRRRQPAADPRPRGHQCRPGGAWATSSTPAPGPGRQGLLLPSEPGLATPAPHRHDHPGPRRPSRPPRQTRLFRRPATCVRPREVQGPSRRRVRLQPPQTPSRVRHPLRQARRPIRRQRAHRQHRPLAQTTFAAGPSRGLGCCGHA